MRQALISDHVYRHVFPEEETVTNQSMFKLKLLQSRDKGFSIEICSGRNYKAETLPKLGSSFCSVTWHSPSADRLKCMQKLPAVQLAKRLNRQGHNVLLHLAGRNLRREQVLNILNVVKDIGVRNIFALQGDPSQIREKDDNKCDFPYAIDLVRFIRLHFGNYFCIGVAGYPDQHPRSRDLEEDIHYLKQKVSSGADFIITQASYNYQSFVRFFERCRKADIHIPIIPGIFVISSYKTLIGISKFCSVPVSSEILSIVSKNKDNDEAVRQFGIYQATELINNILSDREHVFNGIHIFSLNNLKLVKEVIRRVNCFKNRLEYPL